MNETGYPGRLEPKAKVLWHGLRWRDDEGDELRTNDVNTCKTNSETNPCQIFDMPPEIDFAEERKCFH